MQQHTGGRYKVVSGFLLPLPGSTHGPPPHLGPRRDEGGSSPAAQDLRSLDPCLDTSPLDLRVHLRVGMKGCAP